MNCLKPKMISFVASMLLIFVIITHAVFIALQMSQQKKSRIKTINNYFTAHFMSVFLAKCNYTLFCNSYYTIIIAIMIQLYKIACLLYNMHAIN